MAMWPEHCMSRPCASKLLCRTCCRKDPKFNLSAGTKLWDVTTRSQGPTAKCRWGKHTLPKLSASQVRAQLSTFENTTQTWVSPGMPQSLLQACHLSISWWPHRMVIRWSGVWDQVQIQPLSQVLSELLLLRLKQRDAPISVCQALKS